MKVSVTYEETDVAKSLERIIKDSNSAEFVKLLTPMLCNSSEAIQHFFKLMIGGVLPEVIPKGTLCHLNIVHLSYNAKTELIRASDLCIDDEVVVRVTDFRGYHEYSPYVVEYTNILEDGTRKKDITYTSANNLTIIDEI